MQRQGQQTSSCAESAVHRTSENVPVGGGSPLGSHNAVSTVRVARKDSLARTKLPDTICQSVKTFQGWTFRPITAHAVRRACLGESCRRPCQLIERRGGSVRDWANRFASLVRNDYCRRNLQPLFCEQHLGNCEAKYGSHQVEPKVLHRRRGIDPDRDLPRAPAGSCAQQAPRDVGARCGSSRRRGREVAVYQFGPDDPDCPVPALPTLDPIHWEPDGIERPSGRPEGLSHFQKRFLAARARRYSPARLRTCQKHHSLRTDKTT